MLHKEDDGTKIDLAKYRLETAKNDLNSAKVLLDVNDYKGANTI